MTKNTAEESRSDGIGQPRVSTRGAVTKKTPQKSRGATALVSRTYAVAPRLSKIGRFENLGLKPKATKYRRSATLIADVGKRWAKTQGYHIPSLRDSGFLPSTDLLGSMIRCDFFQRLLCDLRDLCIFSWVTGD